MSTYFIGDIHGCFDELKVLLDKVQFNPKKDKLWLTGDLVKRGPKSLEVLRFIYNIKNSVRVVLGNHDLHLLLIYLGLVKNKTDDSISKLLEAPDSGELINWLRFQPFMQIDNERNFLMVHAGISPQWDLITMISCASEISENIRNKNYSNFLKSVYKNTQNFWNTNLKKLERMQFSVNVFTRIRYCFSNGDLEMSFKDSPNKSPDILIPWFKKITLLPKNYSIIFGHWASIMGKGTPSYIYGIDTGCCWGGKLTLMCWENKKIIQVKSRLLNS